jgi:serine/threonine-protein kinase RsbW
MEITTRPGGPAGPGYTIRLLRPEDAAGVAACVRRVYGDSYVHPKLYHPDQVIRLNQTGELVSAVALDAAGRVVGHFALERRGLGALAEEGRAVVVPEHRHHHLMEALRGLLEGEAHRLGLTGLFGQAVTNHVFTQKVWERFGLGVCGLSLAALPRSFQDLPEPPPQRMSLLLGFKYLRPPAPAAVYAPARHRAICARIYEQLRVPVEFRAPHAAAGPGRVSVTEFPPWQAALIRVDRVGAATAAEVCRVRRSLCDTAGVEAVFLELPLAQAGTPELCRAVEQDGFFFSGIGPCFSTVGDALRLQFVNVDLDIALLQLQGRFAHELAAYVARERERVGKARHGDEKGAKKGKLSFSTYGKAERPLDAGDTT